MMIMMMILKLTGQRRSAVVTPRLPDVVTVTKHLSILPLLVYLLCGDIVAICLHRHLSFAEGDPLRLLVSLRLRQLLLGLLRLGLGLLHPVEVLEVARDDRDRKGEDQHTWDQSFVLLAIDNERLCELFVHCLLWKEGHIFICTPKSRKITCRLQHFKNTARDTINIIKDVTWDGAHGPYKLSKTCRWSDVSVTHLGKTHIDKHTY